MAYVGMGCLLDPSRRRENPDPRLGRDAPSSSFFDGRELLERPSHAGRGPRNFRRSDERTLEEAGEWFTVHPGLDASDIEVTVEEGVVRLVGSVPDRASKRLAEDPAAEVLGVEDVHNDLRVRG